MNICLPYTYFAGDLFRCLCADLHIAFTAAPQPGKYTRKIGELYASGTLCDGLCAVLGSLCECRYLGADTAIVFTPCGSCSEQRIRIKLQNCLEQSGFKMQVVCVSPHARGNKEMFRFLRENSACSYFEFIQTRKLFYECICLAEDFMCIKNNLIPDAVLREYVCSAEKDMRQASGLLPLKVRLSCVNKKLTAFTRAGEAQRVVGDMPYRDGDYFKLEQNTSFGGFFEQKRHWFTAASAPVSAVPCTVGKHCV